MPSASWEQVLSFCNGRSSERQISRPFTRYCFDSREVKEPGTLFFALKGDQRDGHEYLAGLDRRPDVAAVVRREYPAPAGFSLPLIRVGDPLNAAHSLASAFRSQLMKTTFVGVTGSAGKTSAKEFIYRILAQGNKSYRSPGNWNNWLGLPFALMNMESDVRYGVFEMGMSTPGIGEIDLLTRILRPKIAIILNALPVHLEFLGSVERVAMAKCEILNGLEADGLGFYNIDSDELREQVRKVIGKRLIGFSPTRPEGDLHYTARRILADGAELTCSWFGERISFFTPLTHPAQLVNVLAAVGVALALGIPRKEIVQALSELQPVEGRGVVRRVGGVTVLDETYNSNPEAARYALEWLKSFPGPKVAVLGEMRELGEGSDAFHRQLGELAAQAGLKALLAVGERGRLIAEGALGAHMPESAVRHFQSAEDCRGALDGLLGPGDVVLFKASRGVALEKAVPK